MASHKEFLLSYFKQRRFNNMPVEQYARFEDYLKNNDLRGHMKYWKQDLMIETPAGTYEPKELPNPEQKDIIDPATGHPVIDPDTGHNKVNPDFMEDDQWDKLFLEFQNTFATMSQDRNLERTNDKAYKFLTDNFGPTKDFSLGVASAETETEITELKRILETDTSKRAIFEHTLKSDLPEDMSFKDFLKGLGSKKYNTDIKFRNTVKTAARSLEYAFQYEPTLAVYNTTSLSHIRESFADDTVLRRQRQWFKRNYKSLLNTINDNSKIREEFAKYDKTIVSQHSKAVDFVKYDDSQSDDFLAKKYDDELTPKQQIQKWIGDTHEDYLKKYTDFLKLKGGGDRMYLSAQAQLIIKGFDGLKPPPKKTDGLNAFVGKEMPDLKVKSKKAADHFKWYNDTLKELSGSMKKAFAGALSNGTQMKALVSEIILKGVAENKIDEAKTTLEILAVQQFGYTTSKTMETLRGKDGDVNVFSDSNLSWNKNEGVAFVTKAMDKSIKIAMLGIGYGITLGANAVKQSGAKFNGKSGRLHDDREKWIAQNIIDKTNATRTKDTENFRDEGKKRLQRITMSGTGITDATLLGEQRILDVGRAQEQAHTDQINLLEAQMAPHQTIINNEQRRIDIPAEIAALDPTDPYDIPHIARLNRELSALPTYTTAQITLARTEYTRLSADITREEGERTRKAGANSAQADKIDTFKNARDTIKELNKAITARNNTVASWDNDHKDKYKELVAHWDLLQTGRRSHTGKLHDWNLGSAKLKQKKFSANAQIMTQYQYDHYQMVA